MFSDTQELQLRTIVAETLGVSPDEITDETSAKTMPVWNSYNHLTVMSAVEETFGIMFSMEEMTDVANYGELRDIVAKHLA